MPFPVGPARRSSSGLRDGRGGIRRLSSWLDIRRRPWRGVRPAPDRVRNRNSLGRSSRVAPRSSGAASVDWSSPHRERGRAYWPGDFSRVPLKERVLVRELSPRQHSYIVKFIEQTSNVLEEEVQVGLIARGAAGTAAVFLLVVCLSPPILANPAVGIRILFDLGDGTYVWANETVSDPAATNATWRAVLSAANANGIAYVSTGYSTLGVPVLDMGNRHPPAGFIGLYEWNATIHEWDLTSVGISSLVVSEGAAIALYNAGFDSHTFDVRQPVPSPDDPLPSMEFRGTWRTAGRPIPRPRTPSDRCGTATPVRARSAPPPRWPMERCSSRRCTASSPSMQRRAARSGPNRRQGASRRLRSSTTPSSSARRTARSFV